MHSCDSLWRTLAHSGTGRGSQTCCVAISLIIAHGWLHRIEGTAQVLLDEFVMCMALCNTVVVSDLNTATFALKGAATEAVRAPVAAPFPLAVPFV